MAWAAIAEVAAKAGAAAETAEKVKIASEVKATSEVGSGLVSKNVFNPDKRIDVNFGKNIGKDKNVFNPDKRIPNKEVTGNEAIRETNVKDIAEKVKEYISDLKSKSDFPDTIKEDQLDPSKLEKVSPERTKELREQFDDKKAQLRKEWEALNHQEWPTYKEDVWREGQDPTVDKPWRKAGDRYDAHHVQPLELGGENVASNITPLDVSKHSEIHSKSGSCQQLVNSVKGVA